MVRSVWRNYITQARASPFTGGAGHEFDSIKVIIAKASTVIPGVGPVEDRFGYIHRDLAQTGHSGLDKISLGYAKESYTFWQRIPWTDEIAREFSPIIAQTMVEMSDISAILMDYTPVTFEEKRALVKADASMLEHPFIANALARASGEML
ncbi:MAG TPA: hypothetical protein VGA03_09555, partial [Anaerolineales bacterium]